MKIEDRALGAFVLSFIYLLMVNVMIAKPIALDSYSTSTTEKEQKFIIASSQAYFSHTVQFEDLLSNLYNPEKVNYKNLLSHWIAFRIGSESLLNFAFQNYLNFSVNLRINFKVSKLLYPFHFFP